MAYVAEHLASYKQVRLVEFIDEIPKSAVRQDPAPRAPRPELTHVEHTFGGLEPPGTRLIDSSKLSDRLLADSNRPEPVTSTPAKSLGFQGGRSWMAGWRARRRLARSMSATAGSPWGWHRSHHVIDLPHAVSDGLR